MLEGPFLKLPAINIGSRQRGRMQSTNVINVDHDRVAIERAIKQAVFDASFRSAVASCHNPYGDGKSSARIVKVLEEYAPQRVKLLDKQLTY